MSLDVRLDHGHRAARTGSQVSGGPRLAAMLAVRGSTPAREVVAGATTFATMAFILVVNPVVMAGAGMPRADLTISTALAAALGSAFVALLSNQPLVAAPAMGSNVVFASVLVGQMGLPWQAGLAMVFVTGALFLALSLSRFRERAVTALPPSLQVGIQASVGIVILLVALRSAHVIVTTPHWGLGAITSPACWLAIAGIAAMPLLLGRRVPGSLLISIAGLTLAGLVVPGAKGGMLTTLPDQPFAWPHWPAAIALKPDFGFVASHLLLCAPLMIYFFCSEFFSTLGTLVGATAIGDLHDGDGRLPGATRVFVADALATMVGSLLGTAVVTVFVESAAGIQAGGRTGLTTLVAAALFLLALFAWPLLTAIPTEATAPALVFVAMLMLRGLRRCDPRRPAALLPVAATMLATLVTTNLINGIAAGVAAYLIVELAGGHVRRIGAPVWAIAALFAPYYFLMLRPL